MKDKMWFSKNFRGYFLLFTVSGILMLLLGTIVHSQLFIALGGAVVGVNLSLLFGSLNDLQITEVLAKSLKSKFSSEEESIEPYRKKYHCYRVTEWKEETRWSYSVLDFSQYVGNGILSCLETIISADSVECEYRNDAIIREEMLIVIKKASNGKELVSTLIFPSFAKNFEPFHCGIHIHETWDKTQRIDPIIISLEPLYKISEDKEIPENIADKLKGNWNDGITDFKNMK